MTQPVHAYGCSAVQRLMGAGLIPERTRTVIIKLTADDVVTVFYETETSEKVLNALIGEVIAMRTGPNTVVTTGRAT